MILTTHAIVGAGLASLLPKNPALAFAVGLASHFVIDAIPHWDYPLRAISVGRSNVGAMPLNRALLRDLCLVALDSCAGLLLAIWLFAQSATTLIVVIAAFAAMLPDPLQVVHRLYPREPLRTLQRFHEWMHTDRRLRWPIGIGSQIVFSAAVVVLADILHQLT